MTGAGQSSTLTVTMSETVHGRWIALADQRQRRRLLAVVLASLPLSACASFPKDAGGTLRKVAGGTLRVGMIHKEPWAAPYATTKVVVGVPAGQPIPDRIDGQRVAVERGTAVEAAVETCLPCQWARTPG